MAAHVCATCGKSWPASYCPDCHTSIGERSVATAVAAEQRTLTSTWAREHARSAQPAEHDDVRLHEVVPITFTGQAGEYFRIWIVNVALTVLTLGIYAAWAKVRKRQYFWGNTRLGGRGFEYTGSPIAILKGNLIIAAGVIVYYVASTAQPLVALAALVAMWLVYPWLFQKAMRFNAYNTRHRNIRFGFEGEVGESYAINLGLALLFPFTLGLIWPYLEYRRKRYQFENMRYGTKGFRYTGEVGAFYTVFLKALGLVALGFLGAVIVMLVGAAGPRSGGTVAVGIGVGVLYASILVAFGLFYATRITNEVVNQTSIPDLVSFHGSLQFREVFALELVNLLAVVGTLGLAFPWAAVRRARYRWSRIEARFTGSLDQVAAAMGSAPGVLGDVAADHLDIEISL